jgi:hypothetical protein
MRLSVFARLFSLVAVFHTVIPTQAEAATALFRVKRTWWGGGGTTVMVRRFALALGAMLIAVGCATNWVHPDPDADWDAAYADCSPKDEAANGGETNEQAMKDCLEAKGWVEQQTSKPPLLSRWRARPRKPMLPRFY